MSDAPQGPGWWLASDGKYYPPATPPPPAAASPASASPSKRRAWPWLLLGAFVLLGGCTVIAAVALVQAGEEIDDNRQEAIEQTSCQVSGVTVFEQLKVTVTADNATSKRSDFRVEFVLTATGDDVFLGDGTMWLTNIPAGVETSKEQPTLVDAPDGSVDGVACTIVSARRTAAN